MTTLDRDQTSSATTPRRPIRRGPLADADRGLVIAAGVAFVLLVSLFPLARLVDHHQDRQRPMYRDVVNMAWLEYREIGAQGQGTAVELRGGESTNIGGSRFTVAPGVTVRVTVSPGHYCVRGSDQYGDTTQPLCGNGTTQPPRLGGLANQV